MQQFDLNLAERGAIYGIRRVEENNQKFLKAARSIAENRCRVSVTRTVTADDVRKYCPCQPKHYNAWGAVFRDKRFIFAGEMRKSQLVQGHGNLQRVWRLRAHG